MKLPCFAVAHSASKTRVYALMTLATLGLDAGNAVAQEYPNKPIRLVVPFAPGGGVDVLARLLAAKLPEFLGQPVVVEHRPGAGGNVGADTVAKAPPDGYTLLLTTSGHAASPALYRTLPFDAAKDFAPVTQVVASTLVLVANPGLPATSTKELIALAKQKPGGLNYGSSGPGAPLHLAMEMLKSAAGIDIVHIPYRGDAPLATAVIAGDVQVGIVPQATGLQHIKAGAVRALGVVTVKRSPALPDVPTIGETVPGFDAGVWNGIFAPANTPPDIVARIQRDVAKALATAEVGDRIRAVGNEPVGSTPEAFAAVFKADLAKFAKVVKEAHIPVQD
jgi:tripartite-type tricarboxylate transporter receptor subunit TctC